MLKDPRAEQLEGTYPICRLADISMTRTAALWGGDESGLCMGKPDLDNRSGPGRRELSRGLSVTVSRVLQRTQLLLRRRNVPRIRPPSERSRSTSASLPQGRSDCHTVVSVGVQLWHHARMTTETGRVGLKAALVLQMPALFYGRSFLNRPWNWPSGFPNGEVVET